MMYLTEITNRILQPFRRKAIESNYKETATSGVAGIPSTYTFELTHRCNLNCRMCYRQEFDSRGFSTAELSLDEIASVLDSLGNRIGFARLVGSEVFMRKDLNGIIRLLERRNIKCEIGTNGTLIDEETANSLKGFTNIWSLGFSIDGPREIHNRIRGASFAFDRTVKAIQLTTDSFRTVLATVIMEDNLSHLSEIVKLGKRVGVDKIHLILEQFSSTKEIETTARMIGISVDSLLAQTKSNAEYDFTWPQLEDSLGEAIKCGKAIGEKVQVTPEFSVLKSFFEGTIRKSRPVFCGRMFECRIDPEGNIVHCHHIREPLGNLLEEPLEDVWNSERFREFRKKLTRNNLLPICTRCCQIKVF